MIHIEILGPGCPRCAALYERAEQAARELGIEYDIQKVTDIASIARQGVLSTPGLVVNGELKLSGSVPSTQQLKAYLS